MTFEEATIEGLVFRVGSGVRVASLPVDLTGTTNFAYDRTTQVISWTDADGNPQTHTITQAEIDAAAASLIPTLAEVKTAKIHALNNARYAEEVGGFTISGTGTALDGTFIKSDYPRSQTKLGDAAALAANDPTYSTEWQLNESDFITLNAAALMELGKQLGAHEKAGRAKLKGLVEAVQAATTEAEVEAVVW